jgi:hypothetical protein
LSFCAAVLVRKFKGLLFCVLGFSLNNIYLENNQNIQYIKHSKYSCVHIAQYVHVALCGLSDLNLGGCLIINYNVPAILLYKYINSYRYIL